MKPKALIAVWVLALVALGVFLAGRQGVRFKTSSPLASGATFRFIEGASTNWTIVPVQSGTASLGWRVFGRHDVLTYTLESNGKTLAGGKVTIPRFGYAQVRLEATE